MISNLAKGTYRFELKATDNKGAIGRDTITITVEAAATRPMFELDAGEDKYITLPTDSVMLEAVVDDPYQTVKSYSWKRVSGPRDFRFSNAKAAQTNVTGLVEGVYLFACVARDINGNILTDTVKITVEILAYSTATVYPNPSNGMVNVKIDANTRATKTLLTVYDLTGKVMHQESFMRTEGKMIKPLNLSALPAGIYIIEIAVDINNKVSLKMIKQ
jgi:hypothetical protein